MDTKRETVLELSTSGLWVDIPIGPSTIQCNRCMKAITFGEWQEHEAWHHTHEDHEEYCLAARGQECLFCKCWCHDVE